MRYERSVKWVLRSLAFIGIASSLIAFPVWYVSLFFALVLFGIEQFFERAIFQYTTIYVQPFPNFTYDPKQWKGMAFAFPGDSDPQKLNVVGCAFASEAYAKQFFDLLRSWAYEEKVDRDGNICLSFIVEDDEEKYSVYLFPNPKRRTVERFFEEIEEIQKYEKHGKKHQRLVMQLTICKSFPYGEEAQLKQFIEIQDPDRPFWLKPFIMKADGSVDMVWSVEPILKYKYKFKRRSELAGEDIEYQHGKSVMGK